MHDNITHGSGHGICPYSALPEVQLTREKQTTGVVWKKERSQPGEHKKGCIEGQLVLGDHGLDHLTSGAKRTWMHPLWTLQAVQGWGDRERL